MQHSLYLQYLNNLNRHSSDTKTLWNGCGTLEKFQIGNKKYAVKISQVPENLSHVNIKQTAFSLQRKVNSYIKEQYFYSQFAEALPSACLTPKALELIESDGTFVTVLEDFEAFGFGNIDTATNAHVKSMLSWLASFHANWICENIVNTHFGVLGFGNYWHLATRPDEFSKMSNLPLKKAAYVIDETLSNTRYKTLIHGDAKLANFAFNELQVIGYDFQHTGLGNGLSDVMLLFTTVFDARQMESEASVLLDYYFCSLKQTLKAQNSSIDCDALETEWRNCWSFIWADFYRFLSGWRPAHPKINSYMKRQTQIALSNC
ncbi:hypothetical protein [Pseudoalteromonas luteoviolacea]|uniref:CHK kinase-like domain-containing protein n=1 Tax=Pseudoalteromonas luteoviolacea S4054 TaxID=1129367 RepID=A0A0F6A7V5_9GAMM|nr:hypothetical protein [Pseudoalteromonas luteoviolacea]AOT10528.1 hypothetical protein S4054249_21930 [Pseudoalteromonas luteoviolacea]AOT15404.1 hypothetical protein S40542_21665 [Pseudoalteromonas luteoviolacea]AOT20347.1 hypothetical protein S4054_21845 [Pseudoalteromonas luteoviolacea]KKE81479.1 hypothetical protein N479_03065 [Pseudoalteromonas luteoviolacea S4054]KZN71624.1 hypothetical protein N481_18315 [Pseudoalteromonas luteoviolacea S4047-1]